MSVVRCGSGEASAVGIVVVLKEGRGELSQNVGYKWTNSEARDGCLSRAGRSAFTKEEIKCQGTGIATHI